MDEIYSENGWKFLAYSGGYGYCLDEVVLSLKGALIPIASNPDEKHIEMYNLLGDALEYAYISEFGFKKPFDVDKYVPSNPSLGDLKTATIELRDTIARIEVSAFEYLKDKVSYSDDFEYYKTFEKASYRNVLNLELSLSKAELAIRERGIVELENEYYSLLEQHERMSKNGTFNKAKNYIINLINRI